MNFPLPDKLPDEQPTSPTTSALPDPITPAPLSVDLAVAKIGKYATSESGDTVEIVERPNGGLSVVVADGQRSGHSAKTISNIVVRKAISLLAEGVRDGAVARATHDYLRTYRGGKVSAELHIVSIDLVTGTLVLSRNSRCPVWLRQGQAVRWLDHDSEAIGINRHTKPVITEMPLADAITIVVFTDGIHGAGAISGGSMPLDALLERLDGDHSLSAQALADGILGEALRLDHNRPRDDATVLVIKINSQTRPDGVRRMHVSFPL